MKLARHLLVAVLLAGVSAPVCAAPAMVAAAVAAPDRPESARKLDADRKPVEVLNFLGLKKGDRAVELMAGSGYYAELIGKAVGPKGAVVALEPPGFLTDKGRAAWAELRTRTPNVLLQAQMPGDTSLAPRSLDFALMHLTYHDLYWESEQYKFPRIDPAVFLGKLYAAMKPGGVVGVVDHVAEAGGDTRKVADALHRIDPEVIKADFKAAGFVLEAESDLLRMPADDHSKLVFDPTIRGKTDRVVYRFRKPAA